MIASTNLRARKSLAIDGPGRVTGSRYLCDIGVISSTANLGAESSEPFHIGWFSAALVSHFIESQRTHSKTNLDACWVMLSLFGNSFNKCRAWGPPEHASHIKPLSQESGARRYYTILSSRTSDPSCERRCATIRLATRN